MAERILRSGTQTFLEAQTRTMLSKRGLPIPLPPTPDGWRQELRIRLRAFNPAHENTVEGATLEQYSEADLRFGEENSVVDGADAAGGLGGVFRIGGTPAAEGERTTSQKSASQVSGGLTVGGGLSRGRHTGDLGGSLDLNLGTYAGDSEQAGADAVYTIEYRRWRRKRTPRFGRVGYTTTRHVRVEHGLEVLAPYVRAADLGLPEPVDRPRRDLPVKDGERYYLDRDLGMAVAHVEHVGADGVLDAIEEILGDRADPEVLGAVQSAFSEDAVRAQFGIARKGGIQQVIKTPTVPRRGLPRLLPERARPPYPAGPDGRAPVGRGPVPGREPPDVAPLVPARKGDAGDPRGAGPGDRPGPHAPHDPGQAGCDPGQARLGGRLPSPRTPAVAARGGVRRARAGAVDARRRGAALVGARRRAWRRIDHRAAAHGVEPVVAEFAPGTQDGLTLAIALGEPNLRANVAPLLEGVYGVPLMDGSHLTVQLVPTRARWLSRGDYIALNFPEHAEEPERETEESRGWSGGAEFDLGHPVGHPLAEGAERPLLDPGLAYDGGSKRVRVKANSTGDYVEYNRQRDGGYDYYLFDATWLVTGAHGHTVNVPIPNGFTGMLPAAVVQRLLAEDPDLALEAPPPSAE